MNRYHWMRIFRRHGLLFGAVLVLIVTVVTIRAAHPPQPTPQARTTVVILPDPRPPVSLETPVVPPYQTFQTKVDTLHSDEVLLRASRIALGLLPFESPEWEASHYAEKIEAGILATQTRYGLGELGVAELMPVLAKRIETQHLGRRQIAAIDLEAETPLEAMFLTWAVAEGAHQFHAARMQREIREVRSRLADELNETRETLVELLRTRKEFPELGELELAMRRRLVQSIATRLAYRQLRADYHQAINKAGLTRRELRPPLLLGHERLILQKMRRQSEIEHATLAAVFGPLHPQLRQQVARIRSLDEQILRNREKIGPAMGQVQTAILRREKEEVDVELASLKDRWEWVETESQKLAQAVQVHRFAQSSIGQLRKHFASLYALDRRVRTFGESLSSPVVVLSPASRITSIQSNPNPMVALFLTLIFVGIGLACLGYFLDRVSIGLRNRSDVEDGLDLPLLGVIPEERHLPMDLLDPKPTSASAGIDALAATLLDSVGSSRLRTLAIASAEKGEGKTTVSIRLAAALARRGLRVALIDGDLRRPAISEDLGLPPGPGLGLCTVDGAKIGDLYDKNLMTPTRITNLDVLTSSSTAPSQLPVLDETRLAILCSNLRQRYDLVLVDTPAVSKAADALSVGRVVEGVLIVAKAFATSRAAVSGARDLLENTGSHPLGVVLTRFPHTPSGAFAPENEAVFVLPSRVERPLVDA